MRGTGRPDGRARGGPTLTAAICTRDRPERLARAIRSLEAQSDPPDEILVIDNAPAGAGGRDVALEPEPGPSAMAVATPGTRATGRASLPVEPGAVPATRSRIGYRIEPVPGLDFARNRALHAASSEIVAFIDDDAIADVDWVRETRAAFRDDRRLAACMGRVQALSLATPGARLFEANGGLSRGTVPIRLPRDAAAVPLIARVLGAGVGCSMALRRSAALDLGGFDEALDMGDPLPGGGDLDMLWRILESGGHVLYQPRVHVLHEHRARPDATIAQIVDHDRGLIAMLVKALRRSSGPSRFPIAAVLGWRLMKPGIRVIRRLAGRDPLPLRALLRLWRGCWEALGAYDAARGEATRRRRAAGASGTADQIASTTGESSG